MNKKRIHIRYPSFAKARGPGYWSRPYNLWASRRSFLRSDYSNEWRYTFGETDSPDRSASFQSLLEPGKNLPEEFRFVIIGDTGEGDCSQYGLIPLLRYLKPEFMIIIGDLANPAGRIDKKGNRDDDDYLAGFFEPYRDFKIPIWSVPGNHEYYAPGHGKEYYDTFCTRKYAERWARHGLRFVPQPGTYWELEHPDIPIVILGLDTGKAGNLDGSRRSFGKKVPDHKQYKWLEERLTRAERDNKHVIILFHIPALSGWKLKKELGRKLGLQKLHRIIASHSCVGHVICGHDHNFQEYSLEKFNAFMREQYDFTPVDKSSFKYVINGGGGSALHATDFKGKYKTERLFPDAEQWKEYSGLGSRMLRSLKVGKTFLAKVVFALDRSSKGDADSPKFLSFILASLKKNTEGGLDFSLEPVWMEDIQLLYKNLPEGTEVDVLDENPSLYINEVKRCLQKPI